MSTAVSLENFGYVKGVLPQPLFDSLKEECNLAEKERYSPTGSAKELISGLTGNGVPKHYYVEKNKDELDQFILNFLIHEYEPAFSYVKEFKMLTKSVPIVHQEAWINIQEKNEFIPNHQHDGIISYVIYIKIPYDVYEETSKGDNASCFQFTYISTVGDIRTSTIRIDKTWEGTIMMFPAKLQHCVYPFYKSDGRRISISGNVSFNTGEV